MRNPLLRLVDLQKPRLHSCPACPVKGTCVFVTPAYEPGYCLHEYKLAHAFVAQRLRAHPPAGALDVQRIMDETGRFLERVHEESLFDPAQPGLGQALHAIPPLPCWPRQATLGQFAAAQPA